MKELEIFRTRWYRWLGQKCRQDKPYWTTLLNSNWYGWATNIIQRGYMEPPFSCDTRKSAKAYFKLAIQWSNMQDLKKLDNLYCSEKI